MRQLTPSRHRDSEDSAPAEYPPEQPEADALDDDGAAYGAEEAEMQAALEKELAETEAAAAKETPNTDDHEMAGTEDVAKVKEDDEVSEVGSEDLEADSSGSDDEEDEEEGAEGDADEDAEMAEGNEKPAESVHKPDQKAMPQQQGQPQVMVH